MSEKCDPESKAIWDALRKYDVGAAPCGRPDGWQDGTWHSHRIAPACTCCEIMVRMRQVDDDDYLFCIYWRFGDMPEIKIFIHHCPQCGRLIDKNGKKRKT